MCYISEKFNKVEFLFLFLFPVLMYDSENWPLNRSDKSKIGAAEMRFLRPMTGYTIWDKKEVAT